MRVWHGISLFIRKKPLGVIGALILLAFIFVAIFAPWLATYDPNRMNFTWLLIPVLRKNKIRI